MLKELLQRGGRASAAQIARSLLLQDRAQQDYYEQITKNMVGRVLSGSRGVTRKDGSDYTLVGYEQLSSEQTNALIAMCEQRIDSFLQTRPDPWSHRRISNGYISGSIRYEVLRAARFRCELCGISAEEKALEVDHIVPRNKGGSDDPVNFQALCYSCNAMKRDTDDTDFRQVAASYHHRETGCIFCEIAPERVIAENELCFAVRDGHPVAPLHTLIIPKRHVADYFGLYQPERNAAERLLSMLRSEIMQLDPAVSGFNIGMNAGETAGQTVFHCHVHLIPRRAGDTENPRGGVRGVIPSRQHY
jgi:diadenosine tetraphosphate (Ap4A) HIT family hydrolase